MNENENENKFYCQFCNFKCCYQSNYKQHLTTRKHKMMSNDVKDVSIDVIVDVKEMTMDVKEVTIDVKNDSFLCGCGKKYKHRQNYYRHKKKCDKTDLKCDSTDLTVPLENQNNNSKELLILTLIAQNKDLMELLSSQQQQHKEETKELINGHKEETKELISTIKDIVPKIGNNNNNNTTNNKFNLQVFLNEDCKDAINFSEFLESIQVTVEDLENQAVLGYVGGISKLFLDNMKELGVNKRPIHCTDKKRNTLYIKENNEWDKEGSQDHLLQGIQALNCRAHQRLRDMKEDNPEEYSDMDSAFSNKCINIQRSLLPAFPREATFGKVIDSISNGSIVEKDL